MNLKAKIVYFLRGEKILETPVEEIIRPDCGAVAFCISIDQLEGKLVRTLDNGGEIRLPFDSIHVDLEPTV